MANKKELVNQFRKLEARLGRQRVNISQCMQRITDALHVRSTMGEVKTIDYVLAQGKEAIEHLSIMNDLCDQFKAAYFPGEAVSSRSEPGSQNSSGLQPPEEKHDDDSPNEIEKPSS